LIIKAKRTRARGPALRRLIKHVTDGDDNELVELLQGNLAEPEDARADALRFAREFCVRSFVVSPERVLTIEQWLWLLALLGQEFGFNPLEAVVWRHRKGRASGANSENSEHFHVLVREVDAVSGRVLSNSHSFARHEKISRIAELHFGNGHSLTSGAHNRAVASLLDGGEHDQVAKAMAEAGLLAGDRPVQAFNEDQHQRAKRAGLDLPVLTVKVSDIFFGSASRDDFDTKLAEIGLRCRAGEKRGDPIVETIDGELVGGLARLTRLRKKALAERMKWHESGPTAEAAAGTPTAGRIEPAIGNATAVADDLESHRASVRVGHPGQRSEPQGPHVDHDRTTDPVERRGGSDSDTVRRTRIEAHAKSIGSSGQAAELNFALGCAQHQKTLLDLLSLARRSALPQMERVISDLDDVIERSAGITAGGISLPEPVSLSEARATAAEARRKLAVRERKVADIEARISAMPRDSWWRRWMFRAQSKQRVALRAELSRQQTRVNFGAATVARAKSNLEEEERQYKRAVVSFEVKREKDLAAASNHANVARIAKSLLANQPSLAGLGGERLRAMAVRMDAERDVANEEVFEIPESGLSF
jgi:hypothetical protein